MTDKSFQIEFAPLSSVSDGTNALSLVQGACVSQTLSLYADGKEAISTVGSPNTDTTGTLRFVNPNSDWLWMSVGQSPDVDADGTRRLVKPFSDGNFAVKNNDKVAIKLFKTGS